MNILSNMIERAEAKFGEAISVGKRQGGDYVFLIKRKQPVFAERPYMTTLGYALAGEGHAAAFEHGHYDLSEDDARKSFAKRYGNDTRESLLDAKRQLEKARDEFDNGSTEKGLDLLSVLADTIQQALIGG